MQTLKRKSRADFGICVTISVPFILMHVSCQARSKVSVTVTGDQTIFAMLEAEPQRCDHIVSPESTVAIVLYQQRCHKAFLRSFHMTAKIKQMDPRLRR